MIARILFILLAFMPLTASADAEVQTIYKVWSKQPYSPSPMIKVLIAHDQDGLILQIVGKYKIFDPHASKHLSTRFTGKSQYIQALRGGLKWGEEFPGIHQLKIVPASPETTISVNGTQYKGSIYIYDIGGTISAVNELPVEDYLSTMLTKIYNQPLPEETLAALAIAARTNAYYQIQHPKSNFWDVDANQVGFKTYVPQNPMVPLQRAIRNTRHMVLSRSGMMDDKIETFPIQWDPLPKELLGVVNPRPESSKISIAQANEMANRGEHAANILDKAFPHTTIQLAHVE